MKNGLVLEGYGKGGYVEYVSANEVQWFRDILSMWGATWAMLAVHLFYYLTGNMATIVFVAQSMLILR